MMRSLFSGVTGLRTHQTRMDVLGNNISNVNTVGYKKAVANFADLYSDTLTAAQAPTGTNGSVNAKQVGLGVGMNSITVKHTQGAPQYTGNPLDLAITGEGYFSVMTPGGIKYTRAGDFKIGTTGYLENQNGYYVLGYKSKATATTAGTPAVTTVSFDVDDTQVDPLTGKAKPNATTGKTTEPIKIMIDQSRYENVSITSEGQIVAQLKYDAGATDTNGTPASGNNPAVEPTRQVLDIEGKLMANTNTLKKGDRVVLGYVALANFPNVEGLEKSGTNVFEQTRGSGDATYSLVNTNGVGGLSVAALEMSNVDLSDEMVSVITTQRGFQANSRIITVSDTLLEELINLKR